MEKQNKQRDKGVFVVKLIPTKTNTVQLQDNGEVEVDDTSPDFLNKDEFNQFLAMNLESVGQVVIGMIKQIELNRIEIEKLKNNKENNVKDKKH